MLKNSTFYVVFVSDDGDDVANDQNWQPNARQTIVSWFFNQLFTTIYVC